MGWGLKARRGVGALTLLATASALVACGGDPLPADAVPALADRLERIDAAIAEDRPDRARRAVEALVDEAIAARMVGTITADQADEILRAAGELLDRLGTEPRDTDPDPSQPTTPAPTEHVPEEDEGEPQQDRGEDGGESEDERHGEGDGNGPPEGNGPGDDRGD